MLKLKIPEKSNENAIRLKKQDIVLGDGWRMVIWEGVQAHSQIYKEAPLQNPDNTASEDGNISCPVSLKLGTGCDKVNNRMTLRIM